MAELDYDELQRLADAATPGPWEHHRTIQADHYVSAGGGILTGTIICGPTYERNNAEFIAASRSAVPALLDRVRELEEARGVEVQASKCTPGGSTSTLFTGEKDARIARSGGYKRLAERDFTGHSDEGRRTAFYEGFSLGQHYPTDAIAERDAALSAIAKVQEAVSGHPECDRYDDDDAITCGWKNAYASVVRALGSVPSTGEGNE